MLKKHKYKFAGLFFTISALMFFQNCSGFESLDLENKNSSNRGGDNLNVNSFSSTVGDSYFQIIRPLPNEVIDFNSSSLSVVISTTKDSFIPFSIKDNRDIVLQKGVLNVTSVVARDIEIPLEIKVKNHRGSFLKLEIGDQEVRFGLGLSFLVAGQSNTVAGCRECLESVGSPNPMVVTLFDSQHDANIFSKDSASIVIPPQIKDRIVPQEMQFVVMNQAPARRPVAFENIWAFVGDQLAKRYNMPVSFTVVGVGGTQVSEWNQRLFKLLEYGHGQSLTAVLWHQGESDAIVGSSKEFYKNELSALIRNQRALVADTNPRGVPWVIAQASRCIVQEPRAPGSSEEVLISQKTVNIKTIEQAQIEFLQQNANLLNLYPGPNTNKISHRCHFDTRAEFINHIQSWVTSLTEGLLVNSRRNLSTLTQAQRVSLKPIYRSFHPVISDHLFSPAQNEAAGIGYQNEGVGFFVFPSEIDVGTNFVRLYRCYSLEKGVHWVDTNPNCEGKTYEGEFGKIYMNKPNVNINPIEVKHIYLAKELYSCKGPHARLLTPVKAECENQYFSDIQVIGWMPYE
jgi:hypothetical protein